MSPSAQASALYDDAELWELESDLPSMASLAAIELDRLALKRETDLQGVTRLIELINSSITSVTEPASPSSQLNPSTAIAVNQAIADSKFSSWSAQLADLLSEANKITSLLDEVCHSPNQFRESSPEMLKQIRNFCLALSRRALASEHALIDFRPEHPFRR